MSLIRSMLEFAAARGLLGHERVILDKTGAKPYLSRFYLRGRPYMMDGSSPYNDSGNPKVEAIFPDGFGIYIHKFHMGDADVALHNHPWPYAISCILAGGYREERRKSRAAKAPDGEWFEAFDVEEAIFEPGDINVLADVSFHRVELLEHDAWSLFIVAPAARHRKEKRSWSFWKRDTLELIPWRTFLGLTRKLDESLA